MEFWLGDSFVSFDGRVIEGFGPRQTSNGRVHLATLRQIEIGSAKGKLYLQPVTVWNGRPFLISFPEEQRPWAEQLVEAVEQARGQGARP